MATEEKVKIALSAEVDGAGEQSVKTLKQQLKEAVAEAQKLSQVDMGSAEAISAQKEVARLKDDMDDLNDRINSFHPDGMRSIGQVASGIAGGFAAAQGAAALFGAESEELQKTLVKVQAALAISQGVEQMIGLGKAIESVSIIIKTQLVTAFSTLKGAIAATGIGALIVGIGVLINEVIKYNEAIEAEEKLQEKLNEELEKTNQLLTEQANKSEEIRNAKSGGLNALNREIELMRARGATEQELFNQQQAITQTEIYNLKVRLETFRGYADEKLKLTEQIKDKENDLEVQRVKFEKDEEKRRKERLDKERTESMTRLQKEIDQIIRLEKFKQDTIKQQDDEAFEERKKINSTQLKFEESQYKMHLDQQNDDLDKASQWASEVTKDNATSGFAIVKLTEEQKIAAYQATSQALMGFAAIGEQHTIGYKALAIASATIDTYVGAQAAYANALKIPFVGSVLAPIAAAGALAAGFMRVREIGRVQVKGSGSTGNTPSGSSIPATPPPTFRPPSSTDVPGSGPENLGSGRTNQRVYVVEKDIRATQRRVEVIEKRAGYG